MRVYWCIILLSVVSLAHTSEIKEDSEKNIEDEVGLRCSRIASKNIDCCCIQGKEKLSEHCSEFVESCVQLCQDETIEAFSTSCSAREATCHCNEKDVSAEIYENLLLKVGQQPAQVGKKKELQVETDDNMLSPVQFKALASPDDEQQDDLMDEEALESYQQMEFIYPRHEVMKNPVFQQGFCSNFLMRCKQDCPAAFSS
ncbi:hypothetical protein MAM1_0233d08466 [Mucor ambiguus]|uniref:Extracellular membrane protein CFEM domain-containing protein n=1 Tax=Mucor ambiguus TaxID=91626 RepID=A0A0C9ME28_9FUNG|nr:hypothetical protein MAM1_0233d08466 [Mucor ambiguus]